MAELLIHSWSSQCGECKYGGGSWASSPALEGKPILNPDSTKCPECGVEFTHKHYMVGYAGMERVESIG